MNREWEELMNEVMEEKRVMDMVRQMRERDYDVEISRYSRMRDNNDIMEWRRYNA